MPRISGINLNINKRIDIALTYIYGVGRGNAGPILKSAQVESAKRVKDLSEEEVNRIQKIIDSIKVEGD
jgi:small subunit ribosomal protein S13